MILSKSFTISIRAGFLHIDNGENEKKKSPGEDEGDDEDDEGDDAMFISSDQDNSFLDQQLEDKLIRDQAVKESHFRKHENWSSEFRIEAY
ncbi:hypothetical protein BG003_004027 [Podila horticola]|nr:hypothetical protein BG003_004027 [Podila horticola]